MKLLGGIQLLSLDTSRADPAALWLFNQWRRENGYASLEGHFHLQRVPPAHLAPVLDERSVPVILKNFVKTGKL
jgi:hypothetical protein